MNDLRLWIREHKGEKVSKAYKVTDVTWSVSVEMIPDPDAGMVGAMKAGRKITLGSIAFSDKDKAPDLQAINEPFDMELIGVTSKGDAAKSTLHNVIITQATGGWSTEATNPVGYSFVASSVTPWATIQ